MNKSNIKSYAPQARKDFIAAVTARANLLGLSDKAGTLEVAPASTQGDVTVIAGQAWPAKTDAQRKQLIARIQKDGFSQTMEAVAYTWFNRFAALRYMELHDYLGHGHRALSSFEGTLPDILTHAADLAQSGGLPGLKPALVTEMKLAGNRDGELYRMLLVAQCNALSAAMPFLFERIDDETELLLPDNLLRTDSVIARLVSSIDEEDWKEVEIIGWLYQFYISEKKDQVIGKVVKSEDIPAATQLFTPNWIVKYMVQNSLGAQWLATYPHSSLKGSLGYYIEPAEHSDEVRAQIATMTPSILNPEELTLIDPASGSGHILVEAYELFKAIYLERGYQKQGLAQHILEKNLFGLDIDGRAAQLTAFALMMKGRADDHRLFERDVKLNVTALVNSSDFDAERLVQNVELSDYGLVANDLTELKRLFLHATTFGSLIQIQPELTAKLPSLKRLSEIRSQDLFVADALAHLGPLVRQATLLSARYDAVVANPPYMGKNGMNGIVKKFAADNFVDAKSDLFACFIERSYALAKDKGRIAMVTMQSWMFLSSFEKMRSKMLHHKVIASMAQIGYNSFPSLNSKVAQATVFSLINSPIKKFVSSFIDLNSAPQSAEKSAVFLARDPANLYQIDCAELQTIPGSPIAYWLSAAVRKCFASGKYLGDLGDFRSGMATGDNDRFLRYWHEVDFGKVALNCRSREEATGSSKKWFPYSKGGGYRKWYGNNEYLVNFGQDGREIKETKAENLASGLITANNSKCWNQDKYFAPSVTWSSLTSGAFATRANGPGFIFDTKGQCVFTQSPLALPFLNGNLNSIVASVFLKALCPTLDFNSGAVAKIPIPTGGLTHAANSVVDELVKLSMDDWNSVESSWGFAELELVRKFNTTHSLKSSYINWITQNRETVTKMRLLEEDNNRFFIDSYDLADELSPVVPIEQITLMVNPAYRYGVNHTEDEHWARFRQETMGQIVSYAIGGMMGRYSLDEPGLIYAHAGNVGFEPGRYIKFPADADGIVPITDELWFADDAPSRIREFLRAVWGPDTLEENMAWLAESLGTKAAETPDETIRRYIADKFFKDHLQTYKKRPIYWLFSSGKQGAFQALVYLHRYHEGTLARLRAEYVVPLTGKIQSRIEMLQQDAAAAGSTAARNKLAKEVEKLKKKHVELLAYDEQLRHYADMRITIDLDDGVKVNYGKFGDLLAEVKAVTGGVSDD